MRVCPPRNRRASGPRPGWDGDDLPLPKGLFLRHEPAHPAQERRFLVGMDTVRRELRGSVIALLMVAAATVIAYMLTQTLDVRRGSVIYLLPVLLAGWHLGLIPALVAAVAGVLWSGYFFFSPYYSF